MEKLDMLVSDVREALGRSDGQQRVIRAVSHSLH